MVMSVWVCDRTNCKEEGLMFSEGGGGGADRKIKPDPFTENPR